MKCTIKRQGHEEAYDERKVYASAYAACLNVRVNEKKAEKIASSVCKDVKKLLHGNKCVSSDAIFRQIIKSLGKHDKEAAFMYEAMKSRSRITMRIIKGFFRSLSEQMRFFCISCIYLWKNE